MKFQRTLKRLDELATVERGKFSARPRNDPKFFGGSTPFVQTGDIVTSGGILKSYSQTLNQEGLKVSKMFPKGSILVTIAANIGNSALTTFDTACPDSVVGLQVKNGVDARWLNYAIQSKKSELDAKATKGAQKNINLEVLRPLLILTPSVHYQGFIGACLATWDRAIELSEMHIAEKQKFRSTIINETLERSDGAETSLSELVTELVGGASIKSEQYAKNGILVVSKKAANPFGDTALSNEDYVYCDETFADKNPKALLDDSYILTALRSLDANNPQIGYVVRPPKEYPRYLIAQGAYGIKTNSSKLNPDFLVLASCSDHFRMQIKKKIVGGTQVHMRGGDFLSTKIKVPSIETQEQFCKAVASLDYEIRLLSKRLVLLKSQKAGIMDALFGDSHE